MLLCHEELINYILICLFICMCVYWTVFSSIPLHTTQREIQLQIQLPAYWCLPVNFVSQLSQWRSDQCSRWSLQTPCELCTSRCWLVGQISSKNTGKFTHVANTNSWGRRKQKRQNKPNTKMIKHHFAQLLISVMTLQIVLESFWLKPPLVPFPREQCFPW